MKRIGADVVGSLFWVGVGVFFAIGAAKLGIGTLKKPGPGFLPVIIATLLILFNSITLVQGCRKRERPLAPVGWKRHAVVLASILVYCQLLEFLGFLPSTFILMLVLFALLFEGAHRWRNAGLCAGVTAVAARLPFPEPSLFSVGV
jgi:uncharacterized membrane-anchored protein